MLNTQFTTGKIFDQANNDESKKKKEPIRKQQENELNTK